MAGIDRPGPRLGLIEGPAGIGKTSLLRAGRAMLDADGVRVLAARGSELEREFAYGVVRQLFESALADAGQRERGLAGAAAAAAAVFDQPSEEPAAGGAGFATLHGLYWLTLQLAGEEPLALVVDDLHWADSASLRFIAYLVRRLESLEILVLGATRPEEPGADLRLLGELAADPLTVTLRPGPLSERAVGALVERQLGASHEPAFVAACREATGGNPLLLGELLSALAVEGVQPVAAQASRVHDIGPKAVSRAVLLRLGRLSPEARDLARSLTILGEGADLWLAAELAGLDERRAATVTGELRRAEILDPTPGRLRFAHPLVQAAVYGDIAPGERELAHGQAAARLREASAPVERIASHLLAVGPRGEEWAAALLHDAGRQSAARGASENAVAYLQRALAEPPPAEERAGYLIDLGVMQALTDLGASIPTLREAYAASEGPDAKALLANVLGRATLFSGDAAGGAALAREAAVALPSGYEDQRLGLLAFDSAAAFFGPPAPGALERLVDHRHPEKVETLGEKAMAAVVAFDWANRNGPRDECAELALAALDGGDLVAADGGLLPMYAIAALWLADREEIMDAWEQMLAAAHRAGSLFGISTVQLWRGYTLHFRGDLPEAESLLREALESFRLYGYELGAVRTEAETTDTYVASVLARVLLDRGKHAPARALFAQSRDPGVADSARYWLVTKFALEFDAGDFEAAAATADEIGERMTWSVNPTNMNWRSLKAQALDRLGRGEEALELAEQELAIARDWGAPAAVGVALRILGTLERERGIEHLAEATNVLEGSMRRLELARALCEHGTALRLARKPTEAREPLLRALELADVCGAEPLVERCRTELGATGARPRTTALSGVESLTPSERRVADLAASGMSNREIAQELYVTPKTVEVHLSNSYRKLEIRGRRQLPGALEPAS